MLKTLMIFLLVVSIAGVIASELVLVYAMVKKDARVSTRTAGKYIMMFPILLVVVVMVFMMLGQRGYIS